MKAMFMTAALIASVAPAMAQLPTAEEKEAAKSEIWTLEQSIYAGRGKGDMTAYASNLAPGYLAWPPTTVVPMGSETMRAQAAKPFASKEELKMTLVDFSMNGNVAVIYYKTHMTRRADGSPADLHYEVTHTWMRENGKWRVFAGMARTTPAR